MPKTAQTVQRTFRELEIGDELFDAGGSEFGVHYVKTATDRCLGLSGWPKKKIYRINNPWQVQKVVNN